MIEETKTKGNKVSFNTNYSSTEDNQKMLKSIDPYNIKTWADNALFIRGGVLIHIGSCQINCWCIILLRHIVWAANQILSSLLHLLSLALRLLSVCCSSVLVGLKLDLSSIQYNVSFAFFSTRNFLSVIKKYLLSGNV